VYGAPATPLKTLTSHPLLRRSAGPQQPPADSPVDAPGSPGPPALQGHRTRDGQPQASPTLPTRWQDLNTNQTVPPPIRSPTWPPPPARGAHCPFPGPHPATPNDAPRPHSTTEPGPNQPAAGQPGQTTLPSSRPKAHWRLDNASAKQGAHNHQRTPGTAATGASQRRRPPQSR